MMDYKKLKNLFCEYERERPATHLTACITFSSFGPDCKSDYPWCSRTYMISSGNKAFQPDKGGYSIFGSSLDGRDQGVRLERLMWDEHGGKDGWIVEKCFLRGYLVIEGSDIDIMKSQMFYTHYDAATYMLSQLAEFGELDFECVKNDYFGTDALFCESKYRADKETAWIIGKNEDRHWKIQLVYIYDLLNMVFPGPSGYISDDDEVQ